MSLSKIKVQQGSVLHEVICGAFKARGTSLNAWCKANNININSAKAATYGQSGGDYGRMLLNRIIEAADADVVMVSYRKRIEDEAAKLQGAA